MSHCFNNKDISDYCVVTTKEIPNSYNFELSLIEQNIDSYILDIVNNSNNYFVHHLINNYYNYSILIFKSSICTFSLLKNGYYYINTEKIIDKLEEYSNNNDFIFCFITYNDKNNLLIFNQNNKNIVDINKECPQCSDIDTNFEINNNFTLYLLDKLGNIILNKIILNDIDVFDKNEKIFMDLCENFTISGIDIPVKTRIKDIYLGKETEKIICLDNSCIFNNKSYSNLTGICQCDISPNSFDYLLFNEELNTNYEFIYNSSKIKDSFHIFTCINEGYNKNSFKTNAGFHLCIIMIIIQIIFLVFYIIFKNDINKFNFVSNPPKLLIDTNSIQEKYDEEENNDSNEVEQNNQSKDLNESDYEEEIYIDDENMEKKKKNKKKENLDLIEEEKNVEKTEKKLKSEETKNKFNNFIYKKDAIGENNDKEQTSPKSLRTISKLKKINKEKDEDVKNNDKDNDNDNVYDNDNNNEKNKDEKKRKIIIIKTTEQSLITEENKVTLSQMKTMEDFIIKPKKQRSIKNNSLTNKLVLHKKNFRSIHNYSNINTNSNNSNILRQMEEKENEKNDKNRLTLTTKEEDNNPNPIRIRDLILKNKYLKRDSLVSNKKLIMEDSEEDKKVPEIRPKSNKTNKKTLKKNQSKESYRSFNNINKDKFKTDKSSEHSFNNKSLNEKTKEAINMIIKKEKIKKNINISLIDYLPFEEAKTKDFRSFFHLYWNILSLRHPIINLFSWISFFNITNSFIPFQIKIIKFVFMIMLNLFINTLILTQDYFQNKFYYFNNIYNILHIERGNNISSSEKIKYSMNNSFPRVLLGFIICVIIQELIEYIFFCERKKIYNTFFLKGFDNINNKANNMIKKIKIKYYVFIFINFIMMVMFFIYITNYCGVYVGGIFDFIGAGIWTFILLQIFPFISSFIISFLRYRGLKKVNKLIYKISQILSY